MILVRTTTLSTPFPYTALFRSREQQLGSPAMRELERRVVLSVIDAAFQDRKSTRLNSSHSQISYAVFCLKKKNRRTKRRAPEGYRTRRRRNGAALRSNTNHHQI